MTQLALLGALVLALLGLAAGEWSGIAVLGWLLFVLGLVAVRMRRAAARRPPPPWLRS